MDFITKLKKYYYGSKNPTKMEWLILFFILLFCFFTMYYVDIMIILEEGFLLLDCTFSGNMSTFYDYVREHGHFQIRAVYGMMPYFLFAFWAFPVWIIDKFIPVDIFSAPVLLWFKLLLMIFLFFTVWALKELAEEFEMDSSLKNWMLFSFLSSLFLVIPVFEIAQIDIISVALILWGCVYFVKGNNRKFILLFMLAIPMKLFALFVFIPLLLLKEKRILMIFRNLILALILSLVIQVPFPMTMTAKIEKSGFNEDVFSGLTSLSVFNDYSSKKASLFVICFLLLCIWCYIKDLKTKKEYCQYGVFASFTAFLILFSFYIQFPHPYWIVFLAPFIIFQCFMCPNSLKLNLLLEILLEITFVVRSMTIYQWVFGGGETFNYLFLKNFGRRNIGERIHTKYLLDVFHYQNYEIIVNAIFFGSAIALFVLFYPNKHQQDVKPQVVERGVIWLRSAVLVGYIVLVIAVVLIDIPTILKL